MPKLTQNVLYKGRILPAGKEISAAAAKHFGPHVLAKSAKAEASAPAEDKSETGTDKTEE